MTPTKPVEGQTPAPEWFASLDPPRSEAVIRLLVVSEGWTATPQISFVEALRRWRRAGAATVACLDERALSELRDRDSEGAVAAFLAEQFGRLQPTALVLSRYAGPDYQTLIDLAHGRGVPVVQHLDDDLFEVPFSLGVEAYSRYRDPRRMQALYEIARQADVIYTSTAALGRKIVERCKPRRLAIAEIYVGAGSDADLDRPDIHPEKDPGEVRIGYMGSAGHMFDLEEVAPALHAVFARHENLSIHFFGGIGRTAVAKELAHRGVQMPRIAGSYRDFRGRLASLGWDIGLAPLRRNDFNDCKAPTKWVEYSEAEIAVLASAGPVYGPAGAAGGARLCAPDEWEPALEALIGDGEARRELVRGARAILRSDFCWERLERQVVDLFLALRRDVEAA